MTLLSRARSLSVLTMLVAGAIGIISSTQTWLDVTLNQGSGEPLPVPGASAIPVLAPLSLAVLALGTALSITGIVLRYAFGVLAILIGGVLAYLTGVVAFTSPTASVASTVTEATGQSGLVAVAALVTSLTQTPWPIVTLVGWVLLVAAGVFVLATARTWRRSGRKYQTDAESHQASPEAGPLDAIDSWDGLSRGADPTADPNGDATR